MQNIHIPCHTLVIALKNIRIPCHTLVIFFAKHILSFSYIGYLSMQNIYFPSHTDKLSLQKINFPCHTLVISLRKIFAFLDIHGMSLFVKYLHSLSYTDYLSMQNIYIPFHTLDVKTNARHSAITYLCNFVQMRTIESDIGLGCRPRNPNPRVSR